MTPPDERTNHLTASAVRSRVAPAAIGALLLLYFGFAHLSEPTGTDLYHRAALVFYYTLRFGGLAMALAAMALATGHRLALAIDAVTTVPIGLLLIGTGVVMFVDGGDMPQSLINVLCGGGFVSSGRHHWRVFRSLEARPVPTIAPRPNLESLETHADPKPPAVGYLAALADEKRHRGEHKV